MNKEIKIRFKHLSGWLKVAVVAGWLLAVIYAISIIVSIVQVLLYD